LNLKLTDGTIANFAKSALMKPEDIFTTKVKVKEKGGEDMQITLDKLLRAIYAISVAIMILGSVVLINDGEFDIYSAWAVVTYIIGAYLIFKK